MRLDQERQKKLEPLRLAYAKEQLEKLGLKILFECDTRIDFEFKGEKIQFYPYSGWHTGKTIKDGRGIDKLLKQLK
jgi:hypothetical protein